MKETEESYFGDTTRIAAATPMECGVCWWVYDPALGDPESQIDPGVAFSELPEQWRCPHCDAQQDQFMIYGVEAMLVQNERTLGLAADRSSVAEAAAAAEVLRQRLQKAYAAMAEERRGQPACNARLAVEVGRLVQSEEGLVGVAITPWAMNLIWLPYEVKRLPQEGSVLDVRFPSDSYRFTVTQLDGVGRFATCALFATMAEFQQQASARTAGSHLLRALFRAPRNPSSPASPQRSKSAQAGSGRGGKTAARA